MPEPGMHVAITLQQDWVAKTGANLLLSDNPHVHSRYPVISIAAKFLESDSVGVWVQSISERDDQGFKLSDFKMFIPWFAVVTIISHPKMEGEPKRIVGFLRSDQNLSTESQ